MSRPREVSDEEILDAARRVFIEHGPSVATSVVAKELGVSAPALFHRFGSKRALLIAALKPRRFPMFERMQEGFATDTSLEVQLLEIAEAFGRFAKELHPCMGMVRAAGITPEEIFASYDIPPPLRGMQAFCAFLQQAQDAGAIRPGPVLPMALAFVGGIQGPVFLSFHLGQEVIDMDAYRPQMVANFCKGVAA
ncbi:MAG TPA: helix-turn-helix domain-containing protein [Myxococcota bacterium]|nr:helix-turn-helix domain-containing protein [Myxococcota bacterium]